MSELKNQTTNHDPSYVNINKVRQMFDNILHVFHVTIRDTREPKADILIQTISCYITM